MLWAGPPLRTEPPPRPRLWTWDTRGIVPTTEGIGDPPNCADISETHFTSFPQPCPFTQGPPCPAAPSSTSPGLGPRGPDFKMVVTETTPCPPDLGLGEGSRGGGLERSQLWYREAGGVGEEQGDMSHLRKGARSTS